MTKALMNLNLTVYRQAVKEALRQVIHESFIDGIRRGEQVEPLMAEAELLPPPSITTVTLEGYQGREGDFISIATPHDFGIHAMHVTILDDWGERIEGGDAIPCPDDRSVWAFLPTVRVPAGTSVVVQVTAMDRIGGVGRYWAGKTMGEEKR